jgi:hypothetical protein
VIAAEMKEVIDLVAGGEETRLSTGTGEAVARMRKMNCAALQSRMNELRVTLSCAARRRQAYATADAGRLARQHWHFYRA